MSREVGSGATGYAGAGSDPTASTPRTGSSMDPAAGGSPIGAVREVASAFTPVSKTTYEIDSLVATGSDAVDVLAAIRDRTFHPQSYERLSTLLPVVRNRSRGIVADASEVGSFCLLDGAALTTAGRRALAITPGERTALSRPPDERLATYRGSGLAIGRPLTQDQTPDDRAVAVPPALQPLHVGWFGKTGSGKSTGLISALLENHAATDGAEIVVLPKGGDMATDYLQAHYASFGTLADVLYFDCSEVVPAFSFFDIRDDLAAGVPRETAVADRVDHYIELLTKLMPAEQFEQATRSPDVIRLLVRALFDPEYGQDAFSHRALHAAASDLQETQQPPPVSDPDLERMLDSVVTVPEQNFAHVMSGALNRIEKIPVDSRLARIFNHVPAGDGDDHGHGHGDHPHFDLQAFLDEDVVIIIDTGGLREEAQRAIGQVLLSNLWAALRRRKRTSQPHQQDQSLPLVNLYLEEAASLAVSEPLQELLAQSREFDCAVTLAMQFPAQLRTDVNVYDELLNNISTLVVGNVADDQRLARRLATDDMDPSAVSNRLRALRRGRWLVDLPAPFDAPEPRPFLVESLAPPPGHPASDWPLAGTHADRFDDELASVQRRVRATVGLEVDVAGGAGREDTAADEELLDRVDSALPYTERMPTTVSYDGEMHALRCRLCGARFDPDIDGMRRAIDCCGDREEEDRDDVPICELDLKLTPDERRQREWSDRQLLFLQAVYDAQQRRFDPLEYDLLQDSMVRLREYLGLTAEAVEELCAAGLLRHDGDFPHRLYSITSEGRDTIGERHRRGVDYGAGVGDLAESSLHVLLIGLGRRYLQAEYLEDPDSPVVTVETYYETAGGDRLDLVGLDADGEIVVTGEAERINKDIETDAPADFDKMAACDPTAAIWFVVTRDHAHDLLEALHEPADGQPRIEKTYSRNTPPRQFTIDAAGFTACYPVGYLEEYV